MWRTNFLPPVFSELSLLLSVFDCCFSCHGFCCFCQKGKSFLLKADLPDHRRPRTNRWITTKWWWGRRKVKFWTPLPCWAQFVGNVWASEEQRETTCLLKLNRIFLLWTFPWFVFFFCGPKAICSWKKLAGEIHGCTLPNLAATGVCRTGQIPC